MMKLVGAMTASSERRFRNGRRRSIRAGQITYRGANFSHRLQVGSGGAWTLFITGPRVQEWGFWCSERFVHWRDFTSGPNGETVGRGCGEIEEVRAPMREAAE